MSLPRLVILVRGACRMLASKFFSTSASQAENQTVKQCTVPMAHAVGVYCIVLRTVPMAHAVGVQSTQLSFALLVAAYAARLQVGYLCIAYIELMMLA